MGNLMVEVKRKVLGTVGSKMTKIFKMIDQNIHLSIS